MAFSGFSSRAGFGEGGGPAERFGRLIRKDTPMTSLNLVALNAGLAPARCPDGPEEAWRKAMRRFQSSLQKIKPAMDVYADAEEAMFEARRALEALTPPESLTVSIQVEFYFNDGLSAPILRRHLQDHKLHDERRSRLTPRTMKAAAPSCWPN